MFNSEGTFLCDDGVFIIMFLVQCLDQYHLTAKPCLSLRILVFVGVFHLDLLLVLIIVGSLFTGP